MESFAVSFRKVRAVAGRLILPAIVAVPLLACQPTPGASQSGVRTAVTPSAVVDKPSPRPKLARTVTDGQGLLSNRLGDSGSAYLKSSAFAAVFWQPFDDAAFGLARTLDRPILLDLGASWCHWCSVMARESYADAGIVGLINDRFVPVKIDVDERPDLDRRYQQAAQLVARSAGWPLTLFLTPSGDVFAGGTYFPAAANEVLPSLQSVLAAAADAYESDSVNSKEVTRRLEFLAEAGVVAGDPTPALIDQLGEAVLSAVDPVYGGIGRGAKFVPTQAIDLALTLYSLRGDQRYLAMATKTLDAMANGAIHDQIGGAFHRLTLDAAWQSPHFEINAALQAAVLGNYLHGYQVTGSGRYRDVAAGIVEYVDGTLADRDRGYFYGGQDADAGPDDDGSYYLWTADQVRAVLPPDEAAVATRYYGLQRGDDAAVRPSAPRVAIDLSEVGRELGITEGEAQAKLGSAREHLQAARRLRQAPNLDRVLYSDRNAALASGYFHAFRVLGRSGLRDAALKTLETIAELPRVDGLLAHAYRGGTPVSPPLLDDQLAAAGALLDAFEATGDRRHLDDAGRMLDVAIGAYGDFQRFGFYDVVPREGTGVAGLRARPYDDGLAPGGNALAAIVLDRYGRLSGDLRYREEAGRVLRGFAGAAREYGPFAAGYALALARYFAP